MPIDDYGTTVPPAIVYKRHSEGTIQLIDIREPHEHDAGRIAGAIHIALTDLSEKIELVATDLPVVFYCRVGSRSSAATEAFRNFGYDVYNMGGGLCAWVAEGLPIEPQDGIVADTHSA